MTFNISLAVIGVVLGWLAWKATGYLRLLFGIGWFLFIPNTIYMVTDLAHLTWELPAVETSMWTPIIIQFLVLAMLGVVTFVVGFYPFELYLRELRQKAQLGYVYSIILLANILIGFGLMLGRVYRIHSWYVVTQPVRVFNAVIDFASSPQLLLVSFLMGVVIFIVYLLLRNDVVGFFPRKFVNELE